MRALDDYPLPLRTTVSATTMQHPTMMSVDVITSIEGAKEETETDVPDAPPSAGAPAASISSDPRPILNHSSHPPDSSLSSPHDSLPHSNLTSRAGSTGPSSVSPSNPPLAAVGSGSIEIQQDSSIISQAVPGTNKRRKLTSAEKEVRIFEVIPALLCAWFSTELIIPR